MVEIQAASRGALVPHGAFAGRVAAVFAAACYVEHEDHALFVLARQRSGGGPAVVSLADSLACGEIDLRRLLAAGEPVCGAQGRLGASRLVVPIGNAVAWQAPPLPRLAPAVEIAARLAAGCERLARERSVRASVIDGSAIVRALAVACRDLDAAAATALLDGLVGWGEGSTPAGDDLLVGLFAGFDGVLRAAAGRSAPLRACSAFRDALARAVLARMPRTTPISAHHLELAAAGHFNEPVHAVRHALLAASKEVSIDAALQRAFAFGATSGADMVSGMLLALDAWWPPLAAAAQACAARFGRA